jgi:hypothetical protein
MKTKPDVLKAITLKIKKASKSPHFNFDKFLKKLGFRGKESCGIGYPIVFINKKLGVVVKRPYVAGYYKTPIKGIKTNVVRFEPNDDDDNYEFDKIFIQPLADVSRRARIKAYQILNEWADEYEGYVDDMHSDNVAMYNGKAVRIDW